MKVGDTIYYRTWKNDIVLSVILGMSDTRFTVEARVLLNNNLTPIMNLECSKGGFPIHKVRISDIINIPEIV